MTLDADTLIALHRALRVAWSAADPGISHNEFEYLDAVHREEERQRYADDHGRHLGDIVDGLGVTRASASAMIAKLERRALVRRFQCRQDARAQHIILTDAGRACLQEGREIYRVVAENTGKDIT